VVEIFLNIEEGFRQIAYRHAEGEKAQQAASIRLRRVSEGINDSTRDIPNDVLATRRDSQGKG